MALKERHNGSLAERFRPGRKQKHAKVPKQNYFPCAQCGALQTFIPGTQSLSCAYCGHVNAIADSADEIREYDLREALAALEREEPAQTQRVQCRNCAAQFTFEQNIHSGECPFCGTAIVVETGEEKQLTPKSLLPFKVSEEEALGAFRQWLKGLWFAPSALKKHAHSATKLMGVYIPYWTYDSDTTTAYRGQRGDAYQVPQSYTAIENGKPVRRTRMVTKIRWTPVSGRVSRFFDDVLVGASRSLPRTITDRLEPWNLAELVPYTEQYLSGFRSEVYQLQLAEGFDQAVQIMDRTIRNDIARDIGGDLQRIGQVNTQHSNTTFKHLLLPIWSAAFGFKDKTYRFVVNGQTGKVQGERPRSIWKIALALLVAGVLAGALLYALGEAGVLEEIFRSLQYSHY